MTYVPEKMGADLVAFAREIDRRLGGLDATIGDVAFTVGYVVGMRAMMCDPTDGGAEAVAATMAEGALHGAHVCRNEAQKRDL